MHGDMFLCIHNCYYELSDERVSKTKSREWAKSPGENDSDTNILSHDSLSKINWRKGKAEVEAEVLQHKQRSRGLRDAFRPYTYSFTVD